MLQNLPLEITIAISRFLDFQDKLNLVKTCRRFRDAISNTILYEELNLLQKRKKPVELVKLIKEKPNIGSQVKVLSLDTSCLTFQDDELFDRLPDIFPNVTKFRVAERKSVVLAFRYFMLPDERYEIIDYESARDLPTRIDEKKLPDEGLISEKMVKWIKNFKSYDDADWVWTWHCLRNHTLPRLLELGISGGYHIRRKKDSNHIKYFNMNSFLPYLKNAPFITKLDLSNCCMSLKMLEMLHEYCVHIKSLVLDDCVVDTKDSDFPQSIVPACHVSLLSMVYTYLGDEKGVFLDYILRKYPGMQHFDFRPSFPLDLAIDTNYQNYGEDEQKTHRVFSRVDRKLVKNAYHEKWTNFLANLPKSLKHLKLNPTVFDNVLSTLAASDIKLDSLECQSWNKSHVKINQLEYLKEQTHLKYLLVKFDYLMLEYSQELFSSSVTKLDLGLDDDKIGLDFVLSKFPSLEALYMHSWMPIYSGSFRVISRSQTTYPNLHYLDLSNICAHPNLFGYIKHVAPNLRELAYPVFSMGALQEKNVYFNGAQTLCFIGWNLRKCNLVMKHQSYISELEYSSDNYEYSNRGPYGIEEYGFCSFPSMFEYVIHKIYCLINVEEAKKEIIIPSSGSRIDIPPENRQYKNAKRTEKPRRLTRVDITCSDNLQLKINGFLIKKLNGALVVEGVE